MPAPSQGAPFQSKHTLGLTSHRTSLRMRIIHIVSQVFIVNFFPPGILSAFLPLPVHGSFMTSLVPLHGPLARPLKSSTLEIGPFFGGLGWRKCRWNYSMLRPNRQPNPRTSTPAE